MFIWHVNDVAAHYNDCDRKIKVDFNERLSLLSSTTKTISMRDFRRTFSPN